MIDEKRLAEIRERKIPQRFDVTMTHAFPDSSGRWCYAEDVEVNVDFLLSTIAELQTVYQRRSKQ